MSYTIIDVERQTGISSRTLRFWATKDLFPFTECDKNGVRHFSQKDVEWAQWIECLRSLDMSIEDIRTYIYLTSLGVKTATKRKHLLQRQQIKIEEHLEKLRAALKKVKLKIAIYEDMEEMGEDLLDSKSKFYYKKLPKYKENEAS